MFTINAVDARNLQMTGISPDEHMQAAITRCQDAIIDSARRGYPKIEVAVFNLKDDQFEKLISFICEAGFSFSDNSRHNDKTHVITIHWSFYEKAL